MENKQMKCIKGESCLHCGSNYCRFVDELNQLKQNLAEIEEIINDFAKQDILTFPDLKPEENYKLIQKQCGEPIIQILQKIRECEVE